MHDSNENCSSVRAFGGVYSEASLMESLSNFTLTFKRFLIAQQLVNVSFHQCEICPKKCGRVEYVNTCMKELFIPQGRTVQKGGSNSPNPLGKPHPAGVHR